MIPCPASEFVATSSGLECPFLSLSIAASRAASYRACNFRWQKSHVPITSSCLRSQLQQRLHTTSCMGLSGFSLMNPSLLHTHCLASAFFLSFVQSPSDLKVLAFYVATKVVLYEWCQVLLSACNMPFPSSAMAVQGPENEIEMGAVGAGQSGGEGSISL